MITHPILRAVGVFVAAFRDYGFGRLRRRWGGNPTYMASFWSGGAFAFATALVRWLMVGHV